MFSGNRSSLGLREIRAKKGYLLVDKKLPENFLLAMKHNLGFAAIMPVLSAEFRCYGIIRNPLAVLVPCHRVVRRGGALSGYRWGVDRKRRLLARERARTA